MENSSGMGVAALVLGIIGIISAFCFAPLGLILAILSIIMGIIGISKSKSGMAIAGLVLGVLSLIVSGVMILIFIGLLAAA